MSDTNGNGSNGSGNGNGAGRGATRETFMRFFRAMGIGRFDEDGTWHPPEEDAANGHGAGKQTPKYTGGDRREICERARKYVAKMPVAVAGNHGHTKAFEVALILMRGFDLSEEEATPIMADYSSRCQPPWSEAEIRHKLRTADADGRMERGCKLRGGRGNGHAKPDPFAKELPQPEIVITAKEWERQRDFPVEAFPEPLAAFASEVAESISCPVDFPAVIMLAVAGSAIGASVAVEVKSDWSECPRFYVAIVADPGAAKTGAVKAVCRPLYRRQSRLSQEWRRRKEQYDRDKEAYDGRKKRADNAGAPVKPKLPPYPHVYTTDYTTESLAPILAENPRGVSVIQDEITRWVMSMNQYKGGKGSDRQFWLTAWSGEETKVDRKSTHESGSVILEHPFVNVLGGIQPDMLSCLCDERSREDGFIHRILFSFPPRMRRRYTKFTVSRRAREAWHRVIDSMLDIEMGADADGVHRPAAIGLTDDANEIWEAWIKDHQEESGHNDFPYSLIGPWAKLEAYCLRIALVIHLMRYACAESDSTPVDAESMKNACAVVNYFKFNTSKVYGQIHSDRNDNRAEVAVRWIRAHGGRCTNCQLVKYKVAGVRKSSEAAELIRDLVDRDYGDAETMKAANGRAVLYFTVKDSE